jgi:hypothetical protein
VKGTLLTLVAACSIVTGASVCAQTEQRIGAVVEVQMDAANRVGYEHLTYVKMSGTWANVSCSNEWGYFHALDNPHFLAAALTARRQSTNLRIVVDDSQVKVGGMCQIINMAL